MQPIPILPTVQLQVVEPAFFEQADTLMLARWLLGKYLVTCINNTTTAVQITETEAYLGTTDRACHAFGGKKTARTAPMYLPGGHAYVYLCYGLHHLFNIVTHAAGEPHAILIRAGEPVAGIEAMLQRRQKNKADFSLTRGPGALAQALGLHTGHTGLPLAPPHLYIAGQAGAGPPAAIAQSARIGVSYAGADALLPYRFFIPGSKWVSGTARLNRQ
ncbi:MAG: DNA-3-methyladenine glycosylase [Chitinophagaceae bacterium]|nr:DNA-3-methyladenine glycosylase [Chitinophagaceae bacterium]